MWRLRHAWDVIACTLFGHIWQATDFRYFTVEHVIPHRGCILR